MPSNVSSSCEAEAPSAAVLLEQHYAEELARPAPQAASAASEAIRRRHGASLLGVLFYGSCLRRDSAEGVLDLIAVVDRYRSAYASWSLALGNAVLPPNVFYLEAAATGTAARPPWRAKYAVFSLGDLQRHARPGAPQTFVWARLCQPTRLVYARDAGARRALVKVAATAARTAVASFAPLAAGAGPPRRVTPQALWRLTFRETYRAEWRVEDDETIRSLVAFAPAHYARVTRLALEAAGLLAPGTGAASGAIEVTLAPGRRARARARWAARRLRSKALAVPRLLKSALTFGDWVPYALWKLERHRGVRLEPSARQRRHPFLLGWPLLLRVLRTRQVR